MKRLVVAGLVRLYPSRWRAEYGEEFAEVLMQRPLGWGAFVNVAANAAWQQLRLQEPWLLMGVPLLVLATWYWVLVFGGMEPWSLYADAAQTWWLSPAIFALAGFWTRLRIGRAAGRAAMKVSAVAALPFFLVGLSALGGVTQTSSAGAGQFWMSCCRLGSDQPNWDVLLSLLMTPILQIPFAGLLGWLGGQAGRLRRT